MSRAPSLFISHGSPMFALEPGVLGPEPATDRSRAARRHRGRGRVAALADPRRARGATAAPATIHDFGGFPAPLYALQYTPPGAPELARSRSCAMLVDAGFAATLDARRGLDHGAWVPLRYLKPDGRRARVPGLAAARPRRRRRAAAGPGTGTAARTRRAGGRFGQPHPQPVRVPPAHPRSRSTRRRSRTGSPMRCRRDVDALVALPRSAPRTPRARIRARSTTCRCWSPSAPAMPANPRRWSPAA